MAKDYDGPKQLLPVAGQPIVERMLDQLPSEVDELIFVVGGPHEQTIRDHYASGDYKGRKISWVRQEEQLGVAHAFWQARDLVKGRWIGILPDDVYVTSPFKDIMEHELAVVTFRVDNPEAFGVLVVDDDGYLIRSVEKPPEYVSDLINCGVMMMDEDFMTTEVETSDRGEYEVPDVWTAMIEQRQRKIKVVETELWLPINDKEQLAEAERVLGER